MSESMIERVAIAIATSHLNDPPDPVCVFDFYALTGDVAEKYYAMARAAIEAMREPTDEMCTAGDGCCGEYGCGVWRMREIFTAQIDAALKD